MVRKLNIKERKERLEKERENRLKKLEGWRSLEAMVRHRLEKKHVDEITGCEDDKE